MNARATFTRMDLSTQQDRQLIGAKFMHFAKGLPDRVLAHLQGYNFFHYLGMDRNMRDIFNGHPHYERTAELI